MPSATAASTQADEASPACKWRSAEPTLAARRSHAEANGDGGEQASERSVTSVQAAQHRADADCTQKPRQRRSPANAGESKEYASERGESSVRVAQRRADAGCRRAEAAPNPRRSAPHKESTARPAPAQRGRRWRRWRRRRRHKLEACGISLEGGGRDGTPLGSTHVNHRTPGGNGTTGGGDGVAMEVTTNAARSAEAARRAAAARERRSALHKESTARPAAKAKRAAVATVATAATTQAARPAATTRRAAVATARRSDPRK